MGDRDRPYRTREEEELWKSRDPIERLAASFRAQFGRDPRDDGVQAEVEAELEAALEFASSSPYPDPGEVNTNVFGGAGA
jgi:TPP-dependent pyruvate/acetoin dehydrogenase alpha subunit